MADPASPAWPATGPVVYLHDTAGNRLERALLRDWLRSSEAPGAGEGEPEMVPVRPDRSAPTSGRLREVLERPDDTVLVPLRVAWLPSRDPHRSLPRLRDLVLGDARHPALPLPRVVARQDQGRARCLAGTAATLGELRARYQEVTGEDETPAESFTAFVLRQVDIALEVQERTLQGRRYKVPRQVIEGIEGSSRYQQATRDAATTLQRPLGEVRSQARRYLAEMVATPSTFFIDWVGTLTRWIASLGYRQIVTDPGDVERVRGLLHQYPVALLYTHKSHVDAIALMSVMYDHDLPTPHSMGGLNMAFAGVGYAGRRSGTVFIRRSFRDNPVYKLALQQYLGYLMEKRFPLSWAFEGTRSRVGKLGRPRFGLLKYVIEAAHVTGTEDLHLVPVSISYDLIGETVDHAREDSGTAKQDESLGWFMDYLQRLRSPMGNVYLDFAESVVLPGPAPEASDALLADVAAQVARRANECVPVTLPSLLCLVLLGSAPRALTRAELDARMLAVLGWLRDRGVRLAPGLAREDLDELQELAESIFERGPVERVTEGGETLYAVRQDQYSVAGYYRNTIVHYFVGKAIAEIALARVAEQEPARRAALVMAEARWLRDLTRLEFFHDPEDGFEATIEHELAAGSPRWQEVLAGSRGDVIGMLADLTPLVAHAVLLPFLEAYAVLLRTVHAGTGDEVPERSQVLARALRDGRTAVRRGRVTSPASISKAVFENAYAYLGEEELLDRDEETARRRGELLRRLEDTLRRTRQVQELAHPEPSGTGEDPADW